MFGLDFDKILSHLIAVEEHGFNWVRIKIE